MKVVPITHAKSAARKIGREAWGNGKAASAWVTKKQLALHLNLSERTIERYMKMGMPYHKPNGTRLVRYSLAAVDAWIATQMMIA